MGNINWEGVVLCLVCHVVYMTSLVDGVPIGARTSFMSTGCTAPGIAVYNVKFQTYWSKDLFPRQYPLYRPHAQWSKVVGRSHNPEYVLWRANESSSSGFTEFAERGTTTILDLDLQGQKGVFDAFLGANIDAGVGQTTTSLFVDSQHSLVSLAAHIVPSPDWFVGLDSESLCSGSNWITEKILDLRIWDAGTDRGFTFTAPNWAETPIVPIREITSTQPNNSACSFYYRELSRLPTIATATFTRVREDQAAPNPPPQQVLPPQTGNSESSAAASVRQPEGIKGRSPNDFYGLLADHGMLPTTMAPKAAPVPSLGASTKVGMKETIPQRSTKNSATQGNKKKPKLSKEERRKLRRQKKTKAKKTKRGKRGRRTKDQRIISGSSTLVGMKPKDIDCAVSSWTEWSACSKTCGFGKRMRSRAVTQFSSGRGLKCPALVEDEMCGTMRGCGWTHFSTDNWSALGK